MNAQFTEYLHNIFRPIFEIWFFFVAHQRQTYDALHSEQTRLWFTRSDNRSL